MYDKGLGQLIEPFNKDNIIELFREYKSLLEQIEGMRAEHDELVNSYKELSEISEHDKLIMADVNNQRLEKQYAELNDKMQKKLADKEAEYHCFVERITHEHNEEIKKLAAANEELNNENKTFIKVMDNQSNIIDILLANQRAVIDREERRIQRSRYQHL